MKYVAYTGETLTDQGNRLAVLIRVDGAWRLFLK